MKIATLVVACLASSVSYAFDLVPYTATYQFNLNGQLSGTATRVLSKQADNQYRYQFNAAAMIANANELSDFKFDGQKVQSLHYENTKQILFKTKKSTVDFDWSKNQANAQRNGEVLQYALTEPATLDPLNLEIQIRQDLSKKSTLKGKYSLGDAKGLNPLAFELEGAEKITTPYGEIDTIKVSRVHQSSDRKTQFWLAKSLNYLPVKVVQIDDGAIYTIELQSYQATGVAAEAAITTRRDPVADSLPPSSKSE
jgi:hypothetical protein